MIPPLLDSGLEDVYEAFWELSTDRVLGFGAVGPLPSRAITGYLNEQGYTDLDERAYIRDMLRYMDKAFQAHMNRDKGKRPGQVPVNAPELTASAFDALFSPGKKAKEALSGH